MPSLFVPSCPIQGAIGPSSICSNRQDPLWLCAPAPPPSKSIISCTRPQRCFFPLPKQSRGRGSARRHFASTIARSRARVPHHQPETKSHGLQSPHRRSGPPVHPCPLALMTRRSDASLVKAKERSRLRKPQSCPSAKSPSRFRVGGAGRKKLSNAQGPSPK